MNNKKLTQKLNQIMNDLYQNSDGFMHVTWEDLVKYSPIINEQTNQAVLIYYAFYMDRDKQNEIVRKHTCHMKKHWKCGYGVSLDQISNVVNFENYQKQLLHNKQITKKQFKAVVEAYASERGVYKTSEEIESINYCIFNYSPSTYKDRTEELTKLFSKLNSIEDIDMVVEEYAESPEYKTTCGSKEVIKNGLKAMWKFKYNKENNIVTRPYATNEVNVQPF